jgi:hypothetical protein
LDSGRCSLVCCVMDDNHCGGTSQTPQTWLLLLFAPSSELPTIYISRFFILKTVEIWKTVLPWQPPSMLSWQGKRGSQSLAQVPQEALWLQKNNKNILGWEYKILWLGALWSCHSLHRLLSQEYDCKDSWTRMLLGWNPRHKGLCHNDQHIFLGAAAMKMYLVPATYFGPTDEQS